MEDEQAARVAALVRQARRSRQWSGKHLAEIAGVAPGTVVSIENARTVRPGNLRAVLDALELSPGLMRPNGTRPAVDEDIDLALDVIRRYLESKHGDIRRSAARDLIRFVVSRTDSTEGSERV